VGASSAGAQGASSPPLDSLRVGDRTHERLAGFSWHSPDGTWGDVTNRRMYLTSLVANWVLSAEGGGAITYTMEFVPLAVIERTSPNSVNCWDEPGFHVCRRDVSARVAVGFGGSPIGVRAYWKRAGRLKIHTAAAVGALVFSSEVPTYNARCLNLTLAVGTGVEILTRGGRAISIGYKFHHLSNVGTAPVNPGLDANIVYVGLIDRRQRK
jgi:hypothetical protein